MWNGYGLHQGWGLMGGMGVGMILFWLLLIVVIVLAVRALGPRGTRRRSARESLDERYARGEIDREEYLRRRADLER